MPGIQLGGTTALTQPSFEFMCDYLNIIIINLVLSIFMLIFVCI